MDPFVGELRTFAFGKTPPNWLPCDGRLLQIKQYQALYALLSIKYGGDGVNTFALPDMRGRANLGMSTTIPQGKGSGVEGVSLTTAQIPPHTHMMSAYNGAGNSAITGSDDYITQIGVFQSTPTSTLYAVNGYVPAAPAPVALQANSIATAGSGAPHENRQPFLALNVCIATQGYFPPRD